MSYKPGMSKLKIRSLLWFDCAAAGIVGVAMIALSGMLAPLLGIPRAVFVTTALVNLAYGAFSYSLARQPAAPRHRVRALVVANFAWAAVCVGLAAENQGRVVEATYQQLLLRGADPGGLEGWRNLLAGGHSVEELELSFMQSGEFTGP